MRTVVVVQARMTSTRLPGKVLMDLQGKPMLQRQIERLQRCENADEIVLAITTNAADDPIETLADTLAIRVHRGSEHDVLDRYLGAARGARADVIVRVTSDCPLIDAHEVDVVIDELTAGVDYAANLLIRDLPRGLDAEALHRDVLERIARIATSQAAREHVTWFIRDERPELFVSKAVRRPFDAADLRWTVDTPEDLELARTLYEQLDLGATHAPFPAILEHVRAHPELAAINAHIEQKRA
jgi:spore coat polysaccharide biosynthesis protein SpsF